MDYFQGGAPTEDSKMEDVRTLPMETTENNGVDEKAVLKKPWHRLNTDGSKIKKKRKPGDKDRRLKKYVQPKNAVMCLNELRVGLVYTVEQESVGIGQPYCISVEVDGQKYRAFGSSKGLAKQAAAEAALISFVKPPTVAEEDKEEDKTPWSTLASFAIYKLFNEWREGRVGMTPLPQSYSSNAIAPNAALQAYQMMTAAQTPSVPMEIVGSVSATALDAYLAGGKPQIEVTKATTEVTKATTEVSKESKQANQKPAKVVPEGASSMNPVMLLHQLRPGVAYETNRQLVNGVGFFTVISTIEEQVFTGEGTNMKKAKLDLAKKAIKGIFNIDSAWTTP